MRFDKVETKKNDIVTIICYGMSEEMTRSEAIAFYMDAVLACEGSEQSRYATILGELLDGESVCSDEDA